MTEGTGKIGGRVIALTGAASFLGKNLIGLLEEEPSVARIVAIDLDAPKSAGEKTLVFPVDLTLQNAKDKVATILTAERVDTLVHLAFLSRPTHAAAFAHELESIGTMHVMHAARVAALPKLVLWSQTMLYGALPSNPNYLTETHPLRADASDPFFGDKIAAEREANAFAERRGSRGAPVVTILRTAPILGATVNNYITRYLGMRAAMTLLGYDPLWQLVHEVDVLAAFRTAILGDYPGTFNIVGEGVLPLSRMLELAGAVAVPTPGPIARATAQAMWAAGLGAGPPSFLAYLRYVCVADGDKARRVMGFTPMHNARDAAIDFARAEKLRGARTSRTNDDRSKREAT
jgi:UDP-glucose 4-epimerase